MKFKKALSLITAFIVMSGVTSYGGVYKTFAASNANLLSGAGLDENLKFDKTRTITVEVYDRGQNTGEPVPEDSMFAEYIRKGMLDKHNVEVVFEPVPRWTEGEALNNLLAAGDAPDICLTYSSQTIQAYANMDGVMDMAPYIDDYKEILPNLWALLGEQNLYNSKKPVTGEIWWIESVRYNNGRVNTFVREDWLNKLNLPAPTTFDEFEAMLYAFKDNAVLLMGKDAKNMIPFATNYDVGWGTNNLLLSFVPDAITEKDMYMYGFDNRQFLYPEYKEGVRVVNKWYNEGLIWPDFTLYGPGDSTLDNLIKAGYAGALMGNFDYVYRDGENGIHGSLKRLVGDDAAYIVVDCFQNDAGKNKKILESRTSDRKIFFPTTNKEPIASMLYLEWISTFDNFNYLQLGEEGVHHEILPDGTVKMISSMPGTPQVIKSQYNIDFTITLNGLNLGDDSKTYKSMALGYAGVDSRYIETALKSAFNDGIVPRDLSAVLGEVKSEAGMDEMLKNKRDSVLCQAVTAKPDKFDAVYDKGMADYLKSAGQTIINERTEKWEKAFGSATMVP